MSKQVNWNKIIYDEFLRLAILTDDEKKVLETRLKNYSRIQQSEMLGVSVATIDRIIKSLKIKYDQVQPYSEKLPKRRLSLKEISMDLHRF